MRILAILFSLFFLSNICLGQRGYTTNNDILEDQFHRLEIKNENCEQYLYSGVKPYSRNRIDQAIHISDPEGWQKKYIQTELNDITIQDREKKKFLNLLYPHKSSFLEVEKEEFYLRINPVLDLKFGMERDRNDKPYNMSRGIEIQGDIVKKVNYYFLFTENQVRPFSYFSDYGNGFYGQNNYNFNPYYTYWKDKDGNGYDFGNALGYLEYSPSKHFSIMMGHDRNFYGYGYHSLLLDDKGAPYFQLKANAYFWKFHYQSLFTQFTGQYVRGADRLLPQKYGAFHMLTFKPNSKFDIGLFEGVIFHRNNGFELNYLNPIILYHTIEHSLGSPDNVLLGLQSKYNITNRTQIYGQFLLDDMQVGEFTKGSGWWGNKYGLQLGMRSIDLFKIKNLDVLTEFNYVRPYTYSHWGSDDTLDNYSHYNQPLAHAFGANFMEALIQVKYAPTSKIQLSGIYDYSQRGLDDGGSLFGNNIFANTIPPAVPNRYDNTVGQGREMTVHQFHLNSSYALYHNIFLDLDFMLRNTDVGGNGNTTFGVIGGLRANLKKRRGVF